MDRPVDKQQLRLLCVCGAGSIHQPTSQAARPSLRGRCHCRRSSSRLPAGRCVQHCALSRPPQQLVSTTSAARRCCTDVIVKCSAASLHSQRHEDSDRATKRFHAARFRTIEPFCGCKDVKALPVIAVVDSKPNVGTSVCLSVRCRR